LLQIFQILNTLLVSFQGAELSMAHVILSELLTLLKREYPRSADVIEETPAVKKSGFTDKIKSLGRSLISRPEKEAERIDADDDDLMTGCLLNDPTLQVQTIQTFNSMIVKSVQRLRK
jgi:hypothetical protein